MPARKEEGRWLYWEDFEKVGPSEQERLWFKIFFGSRMWVTVQSCINNQPFMDWDKLASGLLSPMGHHQYLRLTQGQSRKNFNYLVFARLYIMEGK